MLEVLVVVPARGGSKRLPGKNLRRLAGLSLIGWTAQSVANAGLLEGALLSTDDPTIAEEGRRCGLLVPFLRPQHLASDDATTVDTVVHALDWWRAHSGDDPKAVLVLQPTSPLRGYACIVAAIELLNLREDVNSIVAMTQRSLPSSKVFVADENCVGEPLAIHERSPLYLPNGALYLTRTTALRSDLNLYASPMMPLVLDQCRAVDIDTESDWQHAEACVAAGLPQEPDETSAYLAIPSYAAVNN